MDITLLRLRPLLAVEGRGAAAGVDLAVGVVCELVEGLLAVEGFPPEDGVLGRGAEGVAAGVLVLVGLLATGGLLGRAAGALPPDDL